MGLRIHHDESVKVWINGKLIFQEGGYLINYKDRLLNLDAKKIFKKGKNIISAMCTQTRGGQYIDIGLFVEDIKLDPINEPIEITQIDITRESKVLDFYSKLIINAIKKDLPLKSNFLGNMKRIYTYPGTEILCLPQFIKTIDLYSNNVINITACVQVTNFSLGNIPVFINGKDIIFNAYLKKAGKGKYILLKAWVEGSS